MGGVTFRSLLSNENRLLFLGGCDGIGSPCRANRSDINDTKIKDRNLNLQQRPTSRDASYCVGQIALGIPAAFAGSLIFHPSPLLQRLVAQSVYRSLAVQGGEAESVMS